MTLHKALYICFLSFLICIVLIKSSLLVIKFSNKFGEALFIFIEIKSYVSEHFA